MPSKDKSKDKANWDKLTIVAVEGLRAMLKHRVLADEEPFLVLGQMAALLTLYLESEVTMGRTKEAEYTPDEVLDYIEHSYTEFLKAYRGSDKITFKNNSLS